MDIVPYLIQHIADIPPFILGIFMGLVVAIPLLLLLYVAISGVASLQVSYAAFDKETGPAAQNKQQ